MRSFLNGTLSGGGSDSHASHRLFGSISGLNRLFWSGDAAAWLICVFVIPCGIFSAKAAVNVTQHHNHLSRDGLYIDPAFTKALSAGLARDLTFSGTITGNIYAQPLYIEDGPRGRAVVIVATESNNVFALDAVSGKIVWQTNKWFSPVAANSLPCGNLSPFGISAMRPPWISAIAGAFLDAVITWRPRSAAR